MPNDKVIQNKVEEFIQRQDSFSSVDVQIAIAKDGSNWFRNHDISRWLRKNMGNYASYKKELIPTDSGERTYLYFPSFADADNYTKRNQKAILLDEFNRKYLKPTVSNRVSFIASQNTGTSVQSASNNVQTRAPQTQQASSIKQSKHVTISKGRIRIPASIVKQIGWKSGDSVDILKLKTAIPFSAKIRVHKDGRISIPGKCSIGNNKVEISVDNGQIKVC